MTTRRLPRTMIPTVLLAAALTIGMSGCGLSIREPVSKPSPTSTGGTSTVAPDTSAATPSSAPTEAGSAYTKGDCAGKNLILNQDGSTVLLTGTCGSVTITGTNVYVRLEKADSITVTGTGATISVDDATTVTLKAGSDRTYFDGTTVGAMEIASSSSTVSSSTMGSVSITGSNNYVKWSHGATSASDTGTSNTVLPGS